MKDITIIHSWYTISALNNKGKVLWEIDIPNDYDGFVGLKVEGDTIKAYTWNGFEYTISLTTRKIISKRFTK